MKLGVNTFGIADRLTKDFDGTLSQIKSFGINYLEPCIIFEGKKGMTMAQTAEGLKKYGRSGGWWLFGDEEKYATRAKELGFEINCAHIFMIMNDDKRLSPVLPKLIECAKRLSIKSYVLSLMISNIEKAKEYIEDLNYTVDRLAEQGISLLYHNHESEFVDNGGDCVMDYLFRNVPNLKMEIDIGWVKFGGLDVVSAMEKYKDRIEIIHFKDIVANACQANRDTCYAALGEGSIPLAAVLAKAKALQKPMFIIDQDASNGDIIADLKTGAENIRKYL